MRNLNCTTRRSAVSHQPLPDVRLFLAGFIALMFCSLSLVQVNAAQSVWSKRNSTTVTDLSSYSEVEATVITSQATTNATVELWVQTTDGKWWRSTENTSLTNTANTLQITLSNLTAVVSGGASSPNLSTVKRLAVGYPTLPDGTSTFRATSVTATSGGGNLALGSFASSALAGTGNASGEEMAECQCETVPTSCPGLPPLSSSYMVIGGPVIAGQNESVGNPQSPTCYSANATGVSSSNNPWDGVVPWYQDNEGYASIYCWWRTSNLNGRAWDGCELGDHFNLHLANRGGVMEWELVCRFKMQWDIVSNPQYIWVKSEGSTPLGTYTAVCPSITPQTLTVIEAP